MKGHISAKPKPDDDLFKHLGKVFDQRPIIVALAGPNGAGKTTFFHAHFKSAGLRFLNADEVSQELDLDAYAAARILTQVRRDLVEQRESYIFETVFSDPVGDKLTFLKAAVQGGYTVVLCFIGLFGPTQSEQRVAMRVSQGGHDVPPDKLVSCFPRTLANLKAAIRELPYVFVLDNDDLQTPFRPVAFYQFGQQVWCSEPVPKWL